MQQCALAPPYVALLSTQTNDMTAAVCAACVPYLNVCVQCQLTLSLYRQRESLALFPLLPPTKESAEMLQLHDMNCLTFKKKKLLQKKMLSII